MQVVLDASLLVALVLREPHAERIESLIRRWDAEGAVLNAPLLIHYEVASALTRHRATGGFSAEDAAEALAVIDDLGIVFHTPSDLARTIELAVDLQRHSAYDAAYLALAERIDGEVWTLDGPLARNAADRYRVTLID
ncbi:MAG: type II toxin-antitoxin system VapC family toxin [Solirubrobacterales bacterium]